MPVSLSQTNRRGTAPRPSISSNIPASRSPVVRDGIIRAMMNRECEQTITSTGNTRSLPGPQGILASGNTRSHWIWSPGS